MHHTHTHGWEQHRHLAGIEALFANLSLSPLILYTATNPPLKLGKQKHKKEAKRGQQAASILPPFLRLSVPNVYLPPVKREGCGQTG